MTKFIGDLEVINNVSVGGSFTSDSLQAGNLSLSLNALASTDTDGDIELSPNGDGNVVLSAGLVLADSANEVAGLVRFNSGDAEVYDGASWLSLTGSVAEKYIQEDDDQTAADTAWGSASGGYYTRSIPFSTHGITNPAVKVYEMSGTDRDEVYLDRIRIAANGDISLRISDAVATLPIMHIQVI